MERPRRARGITSAKHGHIMSPEDRVCFMRDLTEHATQREVVDSHAWWPGDLVMWDNRATMRRAHRFDRNEVRDVRRTTLAGTAPTLEQEPVA